MGVFKSLTRFSVAAFTVIMLNLTAAVPVAMAQTDQSNSGLTSESISNGLCNGANLQITDAPCNNTGQNGAQKVTKVISNIINTISLVVGIVAVVMIMVGGLRYVTSGGSDTSVTSAKNTILYAIIGLIIVALSQVMVRFVLKTIS